MLLFVTLHIKDTFSNSVYLDLRYRFINVCMFIILCTETFHTI